MPARLRIARPVLASLALLVGSATLGCRPGESTEPAEPDELADPDPDPTPWTRAGPLRPIVTEAGATDSAVRGVWASRGYGYLLEIDAAGVTRYQLGSRCYATPAGPAQTEMDAVSYRYFRLLPGDDAAIFSLLRGDTNVVFDRLSELPPSCAEPPPVGPEAVAEAFLDSFERHYAFFDRRPPGFAERAARVRAALAPDMPDAELWAALAGFMDGLSDSHTKLIGEVAGERRRVQDGQGETLPRIRASEGGESEWVAALIAQARAELGDTAHLVGDGRILWGVIDGRVGYLQVFVMGGFTEREDFASEAWAAAELAELDRILDQAFTQFAELDAVILDLSNNRGGWDQVAKALPARFTDQPFVAFTTRAHGSSLAPFPHTITPADGPRYLGPVYVLTSDVTVSGGELATLALRQLPNVTQAGQTTRGSFSTPLPKRLPNGWLLELSNEVFAAPDGTVPEETGLVPELPLPVYPPDAPIAGHWRAIETIARLSSPPRPA